MSAMGGKRALGMKRFSSLLDCRIARSHLSFMSCKRGQDLGLLLLRDLEDGERSPKLRCYLIELCGGKS